MPEALARYVNHRRRRPQLAQTVSSMEVHALSPFVHFEQVRMIEAGEQIFVDYGKEYFVDAQGRQTHSDLEACGVRAAQRERGSIGEVA